ncbi:MAG: hypothetical protein ABI874_05685, partial [Chloroflexota bacterium]
LAHLTRADGFLLSASYFPLWWNSNRNTKPLFAVLSGYLLVMLPWFARNVLAFGAPLVGGGALFMRTYDDLFSYETPLTFDYWLAGGADHIAATMLRALTLNVETLAGALCFIWFPFVLIALWRERMRVVVQSAVVYLLVLLFVASFVLSLPGPRGLFLHSLSASLPLLYALAPVGLSAVVAWIARRRAAWNATQAERIFGAAFVVMALLMSTYFYAVNIIGSEAQPPWNQRFVVYRPVDEFLRREMRDALSPVMVINPPAFTYFNQRAALAIPSDDPLALVRAAAQFGAHYVVIESDHPRHLDMLYDFSVTDQRFQLRATFTDATGAQVQLYQIVPLR